MKRIFLYFMLLCALSIQAQETPLAVIVPEQSEQIPFEAQACLKNRLKQAITNNGINGDVEFSQMALVAETSVASKNVISGMQPTVALTLDLTLFIGNIINGEKLYSSTIRLSGAGVNETKAYIAALNGLNPNQKDIIQFLDRGKSKIISYYDNQAPLLIKQANSLSAQRKYDEALWLLSSIPTICKHYNESQRTLLEIWKRYVDFEGNKNLAQARSIWNANQTIEGANEAGDLLAQIYPDACCYPQAISLGESIRQRIGDNWTFTKKIYQDQIDLESQRIGAAKAVGVAFGANQRAETYNEHWIVR